jgi:hypothetical protein
MLVAEIVRENRSMLTETRRQGGKSSNMATIAVQ